MKDYFGFIKMSKTYLAHFPCYLGVEKREDKFVCPHCLKEAPEHMIFQAKLAGASFFLPRADIGDF